MEESETFTEIREAGVDTMKEIAAAFFEQANKLRQGIAGAVDEMRGAGATMNEIFNNADIQKGFQDLHTAVRRALTVQMMQTGQMKREAMARMGLAGQLEEDLSVAQRQSILAMEEMLIREEATRTADKARQAEEEKIRSQIESEEKAKKLAAQKLASDIAIAQSAHNAAMAIDLFSAEILNFGSSLNTVMMEFGALTGSIKTYKTENDKLIASIATGTVTPEAEAAVMNTASEFGIGAEANALLEDVKETERIRRILTEKGLDEFSGSLDEAAAGLKFEDFLKDNDIDLSDLDADVRKTIKDFFKDGLQPDEIKKITDILNEQNKEQIKVLQDLAKMQNKYLDALSKFGSGIVRLRGAYIKSFTDLVNVQVKGAERLAKALGRDLTVAEVQAGEEARRRAPLQAAGLVGGGVQATNIQLERNRARMEETNARIREAANRGATEEVIKLQNEQKGLVQESKLLQENLKKLSDQSKLAAAVLGEIEKERGKRETVQGLIKEFTFASNKQRQEIDRNFVALQRVLATGTLASIPNEMRGAVGDLLDKLENIELLPGMTGGDISKNLQAQMANALAIRARGFGLNAQELKKIFESTTKEEKLINDLRAINAEEQAAAQALMQNQDQAMRDLIASIQQLIAELRAEKDNAGAVAGGAIVGQPAQPRAKGGVIYASEGQPIFSPKGTDTVPAMLTPGEFVVNRKAASRNMGALSAINSGKVQYLQAGGAVSPYSWKNAPLDKTKGQISKRYDKSRLALNSRVTEDANKFKEAINTNKLDVNNKIKILPDQKVPGNKALLQAAFPTMATLNFGDGWNKLKLEQLLGMTNGIYRHKFEQQGSLAKQLLAIGRYYNSGKLLQDSRINEMNDPSKGGLPHLVSMFTSGKVAKPVKTSADVWKYWLPAINAFYDRNFDFNGPLNTTDGSLYDGNNGRSYNDALRARDKDKFYSLIFGLGIQPGIRQFEENVDTVYDNFDAFADAKAAVWRLGGNIKASHPPFAFNNGELFYRGGFSSWKVPNFSTMQNYFLGRDYSLRWMEKALSSGGIGFAEDIIYEQLAAAYSGFDPEASALDQILAYKSRYKDTYKALGFIGKSVRPLTDEGPGNKFAESLAEWYKASVNDRALKGHTKGILAQLDQIKAPNIFTARDAKGIGEFKKNSLWKVGNTSDVARGSFQDVFGYVPWSKGKDLRKFFRPAGLPQGVGNIAPDVNQLVGILKGFISDNDDDSAAATIDEIARITEGTAGIGGVIKQRVQQEKEKEKKDAEAQAAAQEEAAVRAIKNFKVFYGNKQMKREAMEEVLKKDPSVEGAPYPVWRIPPYAKESLDPEGVFDPRIPGPRPIKYVADLKRNAQNFDALFTYFGDLSSDLRGMAGIGAVLTADNLGNINFDANRLKGVMQETDKKGKIKQKASLETLGPEAVRAMSAWSNKTADQWYKFDDEQMRLIDIFFGKNLEKGLTNTQESARKAIIQASSLNPGRPWVKELGNPAWLQAGLKKLKQEENVDAIPAGFAPQFRAKGGTIGNVDWSPKGTDTVPAMLTPGEFVMQKSAVDKYGVGFMQRINAGKGSTGPYFQEGGNVERRRPGQGDPTSERMAAGARSAMGRGSMDGPPKIEWQQGAVQNIGDWLDDMSQFFRPNDVQRIGVGKLLSEILDRNTFMKYYRMKQELIEQDPEFMAFVDEQLARLGVITIGASSMDIRDTSYDDIMKQVQRRFVQVRYGYGEAATMGGLRRDAEALLGSGLNMTMPADVGFLISHLQQKFGDEKETFLRRLGIFDEGIQTQGNVRGYVGASLRIGEPLPSSMFEMGLSKLSFKKLFPDAVDSIYPLYNPPAQDGPHKYPGKYGILGNDAKFHPLDTFARAFEMDKYYALPKLAADATRIFNYISTLPITSTDWTGEGTNIANDLTQRGTFQTITGEDTGIFYDKKVAQKRRLLRDVTKLASIPWMKHLLQGTDLLPIARAMDSIEGIMPALEKGNYRAAKVISYRNAREASDRKMRKIAWANQGAAGANPGALGFNAGGNVPGTGNTDTVPAMLTPGEFVMSKSAVAKYGVGFMRSINNGHKGAPGMKHKGGVQYLSNADLVSGSGGFDFSALSNSINTLSSSIATAFNGFTSAFNGFSALSELLSSTISEMSNISINHNITVNGQLSIPGFSQEAINSIVNTISDQVAQQSTGKLKQMFQNFRDRQDRRT